MESVAAAARAVDSIDNWPAVAWRSLALFALLWLVLTGWVDGETPFRIWTLVGLPVWSLHLVAQRRRAVRSALLPVVVGLMWCLLWWLTTCSYTGANLGEECYVTKAQHLFAGHPTAGSVVYGLFPLLAMASLRMETHRTPPT